MRNRIWSAVALSVVCLTATVKEAPTQELSGEFRSPPAGSFFEFERFSMHIQRTDGHMVEYRLSYSNGEENAKYYGWMIRGTGGMSHFQRDKVDKLWPLKIGNRQRIRVDRSSSSYFYDSKVVRTETITTPAGTYSAFVLFTNISHESGWYTSEKTEWYAPELGIIVKGDIVVTRDDYGGSYGRRNRYELQQVTLPGAVAPAAQAAPPQYDGDWTFTFDWTSSCTGFKPVSAFTVKGSRLEGRLDHPRINLTDVGGNIAADGSVTMTIIGLGKGTGQGHFGATSASGSADFTHVDFAGPCSATWQATRLTGNESPPPQTTAAPTTPVQDQSSAKSSPTQRPSIEARLNRLQRLLDKKLITPAEFEAKRKQILADL